jgi:hypothetical protein
MRRGTRLALSIAAGLAIPVCLSLALIDPLAPLAAVFLAMIAGACFALGHTVYEALGD